MSRKKQSQKKRTYKIPRKRDPIHVKYCICGKVISITNTDNLCARCIQEEQTYKPLLEHIKAECAKIQAEWDDYERNRRIADDRYRNTSPDYGIPKHINMDNH